MKNTAAFFCENIKDIQTIGGREVVMEYTSYEEEYQTLRRDNGLIDRSAFSVIKAEGPEAAEYLDRLCTKDILYLNIDMTAECLMLDEEANALGSVWVLHAGDDFYVVIPYETAGRILPWMEEKAADFEVTLRNCEDMALLSLEGRKSWKIVRDVLDVDVDILPLRGIQEIEDYKGLPLTVCRIGRTGEYGYMFLGSAEAMKSLVEDCLAYAGRQDLKLAFCGAYAEEICMLETRQINCRYENQDKGNVFELCEQWLIQFEKEDYIGHDALMDLFRQDKDKLSVDFVLENEADLEEGEDVFLEDEKVGQVLFTKKCPALSKTIGIALLSPACAVAGIELTAASHTLTTVSSPVVRPLSWDEKME